MSNSKYLPLYIKSYQLIKFLYNSVRNFPKQYKYTLGQDILSLAWQCIDCFQEANSLPNNEKRDKIIHLSDVFDKLKLRLRMGQEIGLISEGQFTHMQTYYLAEIGRMISGWLEWAQKTNERNIQFQENIPGVSGLPEEQAQHDQCAQI